MFVARDINAVIPDLHEWTISVVSDGIQSLEKIFIALTVNVDIFDCGSIGNAFQY
ncbi:MAG: hypothetical protein HNEKOMLI_00701 [Sodalis sp. Psp]|nr:hypothetical protein [Sodalis sp. Psp]MCR3757322.1 hypothetical protein [Sodalis sp. Ppy]